MVSHSFLRVQVLQAVVILSVLISGSHSDSLSVIWRSWPLNPTARCKDWLSRGVPCFHVCPWFDYELTCSCACFLSGELVVPQEKKSSGRSILCRVCQESRDALHWDTFLGQVLTSGFGGIHWEKKPKLQTSLRSWTPRCQQWEKLGEGYVQELWVLSLQLLCKAQIIPK